MKLEQLQLLIDMVSRGIANLGVVSLFHGSESIAETRMENAGVLFHPLTERRLYAETDGVLIETDDRELYREFYQAEGLRFIPMSDESMKCTLGWISRKDTRLSEVARHYIEIMDDLVHEMCRNEVEL